MEFPGILGVALWRLKTMIEAWPVAALGPFFGIIVADVMIDSSLGKYASAGIDLVMAPILAFSILHVIARGGAGPSATLMFILGLVSSVGASALITIGLVHGSGLVFMTGIRHLTVMAYVWASIATEPPQRRQPVFAFSPS